MSRSPPAWMFLCIVGCGAGSSISSEPVLPPTHRDPVSWAPPIDPQPSTGSTIGLATTGGTQQARAVAERVLVALRDADENDLRRLLADEVHMLFPRFSPTGQPKDDYIARVIAAARIRSAGPVPLGRLIDETDIEVTALARAWSGSLPDGALESDLLVRFRLRPQGRHLFRAVTGWATYGGMIVRPTAGWLVIAL